MVPDHTQRHTHKHTVRLLWTRDQPAVGTPDNTQHPRETDIHAPGGIRTRSPSKRSAEDPPLDRAATGIGSHSNLIGEVTELTEVFLSFSRLSLSDAGTAPQLDRGSFPSSSSLVYHSPFTLPFGGLI